MVRGGWHRGLSARRRDAGRGGTGAGNAGSIQQAVSAGQYGTRGGRSSIRGNPSRLCGAGRRTALARQGPRRDSAAIANTLPLPENAMTFISHMLQATPAWVFALFAVLCALGMGQLRPSARPLWRAMLLPAGLSAFSLYGMAVAHHGQPAAWAVWGGAALAAASAVRSRPAPAGTRFDPADAVFHVPGSVVPLLTMLGIFCTKYAAAVVLAMQPALANGPVFAGVTSLLYGLFAGASAGRALRLVRLWRAAGAAAALRGA